MIVEHAESRADINAPPTDRTIPEPPSVAAEPHPAALQKPTATSYLTGLLFGSSTAHKITPVESTEAPPEKPTSALSRKMSVTMANVTSSLRRKSIAITV